MKLQYLVLSVLLLVAPLSYAKTVSSITISPQGAVLQSGSNLKFSAQCTYVDETTDDCTAIGGVTWSSASSINKYMTVDRSGLATWNTDPKTVPSPFGGYYSSLSSFVIATAGTVSSRAAVYGQHPGDIWYQYMTPDLTSFDTDSLPTAVYLGMNVAVGSTITVGSGFAINNPGSATGNPLQATCNWLTSDPTKATVDRQGLVTGIAPGNVTITCGRAGNGTFGNSGTHGWVAPGNVITLTIVNGGTGNQTWYVRPKGGTLYTNATDTATGQCDGKHNADYPGSGVNQPCAVANVYDLWLDGQPYYHKGWVISGGDTVIVAQNSAGYYSGGSSRSPVNGVNTWTPMPTIPSGTASRHTRILGENYANCTSNSSKTLITTGWGAQTFANVRDSQYVDVACFEITDKAQCVNSGNFTNACSNADNYGATAIMQSALTASVNYTDLYIHGLAVQAIYGATGVGVVGNRIYIRGMPLAGINMDDGPWGIGNISVAGGFTLNNSTTEFTGCVEEYPVVHNYPYIECRDANAGGYGDGLGTASATGDWLFDHDIWRYNFQDGLDLLHSGLNSLAVTNSQSYGNDGQQYKIGSGKVVIFRSNITLNNCQRVGQLFGDEPASAIVPGVSLCRAGGDSVPISFDGQGSDWFQGNTFAGYGAVTFDIGCNYDSCASSDTRFEDNVSVGMWAPNYSDQPAALFYANAGALPPNQGWAIRDHNLYWNFKHGCSSLLAGEICADPKFVNEPSLTVTSETSLDNFNFSLSSASPAIGTGITIPGLLTDSLGLTIPDPPSMGAIQYEASSSTPSLSTATITLAVTSNTVAAGQPITISATLLPAGNVVPTGMVSFLNGTSSLGTATLNNSGAATLSLSSLAAGNYTVTAVYTGDSNYAAGTSNPVSITVSSATATPPPATGSTPPPATGSTPPPATGSTPPPATGSTPPPATGSTPAIVAIKISQPDYGFNVIPGSTRRIFATVTNGTSNQVTWSVKSGSAQISSTSGPWVDVTAPVTGSSCSYTGTSAQYGVTSSTQFTIEADSVDDGSEKATATFNVCNPAVEVSVVPFYRTLYANQPADVQSLVLGPVDQNVHWAITSQPKGGDGKLTDSTSRDALFTGTVAGRYQLTATSVANAGKSATAIMYVTGHKMPYRVTPNQTEPVDCTVDPSMQGAVYDVGLSQKFKTLASVPFPTMVPGSTVRLHNEDTTGLNPTTYHEYVEISQPATAEQPFRMCGVPDASGNLPIIDGTKATGRSDTSTDIAGYGLLTLHNSNSFAYWPKFVAAQYIAVEGIQFRNANPGVSYTAPAGSSQSWQSSAACIHISEAQNVAFVGDDIGSCGNGVLSDFNSNGGWGASDLNVLWEGNHIHNNGIAGSDQDHQMYLQSWDNVVQFNRIDDYTKGALGANIKSRGLQDIIRYNFLGDGAQRQMDLVDVKDAPAYMSFAGFLSGGSNSFHALYTQDSYPADQIAAEQEAWNSHFVYGNIYQNSTSSAPIHFSMDTTGGELARKGSLYWYNNTFYQRSCTACLPLSWTLFDTTGGDGKYYPQAEFQTVQAYNNIVWMDSVSKSPFQWNDYSAFIGVGGGNLLPSNWGSGLTTGGAGSGWSVDPGSDAYQNSLPLDLHLTGFDKNDITTTGSIPFDRNSWTLGSDIPAVQAVPSAVCEMPARFAYLPNLGYAVPRTATPSVGATDTVAETADLINQAAGSGRYNTRYSNCH